MSDEQTRLLQAILDTLKEEAALTKQAREETKSLQQTVLNRQKQSVRIVLVFMAALAAFLAYTVAR